MSISRQEYEEGTPATECDRCGEPIDGDQRTLGTCAPCCRAEYLGPGHVPCRPASSCTTCYQDQIDACKTCGAPPGKCDPRCCDEEYGVRS